MKITNLALCFVTFRSESLFLPRSRLMILSWHLVAFSVLPGWYADQWWRSAGRDFGHFILYLLLWAYLLFDDHVLTRADERLFHFSLLFLS